MLTARDFCLWLDTVLDDAPPSPEAVAEIRRRLSDVFVHEIDPALGDTDHRAALHRIHRGEAH